jgi:glycosyltransferase involved in cell wall biosynthesis
VIVNRKTSPDSALTVYDGWPLAYDPFSPAGLHLLALLDAPLEGERRLVLLPGPSRLALPAGSETLVTPTGSTPGGRLAWEQVRLPREAARHGASALVLTRSTPPAASRVPCIYWPTGEEHAPIGRRSLAERLRLALAAGGKSVLQQIMWPADLPVPQTRVKINIQPPRVHPLFHEYNPLQGEDEPVTTAYILYTGPYDALHLRLLLAGWSWAAPSLGDETQLILLHLGQEQQRLLVENNLTASVLMIQPATLVGLAALYRGAAAVVHLGPALPWGDPVAAALASGQALVALDEPLTAARCGAAAYLVPPADPRTLGAALLTLIVEEELNGQLREAARNKVQAWGL